MEYFREQLGYIEVTIANDNNPVEALNFFLGYGLIPSEPVRYDNQGIIQKSPFEITGPKSKCEEVTNLNGDLPEGITATLIGPDKNSLLAKMQDNPD